MLSGVDSDLLSFCEPWLAREPRLLLACQFAVAGHEREQFLASAVIARELAQSTIGVSDRRVAEAKLGWWQDEAAAWSLGAPRHPLARGLQVPARAQALASLSLACAAWLDAPTPSDFAASWSRLQQLAAVTAELAGDTDGDAWVATWLALSLRLSAQTDAPLVSVLPMDLWARHGMRRSQWAELDARRRRALLADFARQLQPATVAAREPALAVLDRLERRWLQQLSRPAQVAEDRLGIGDAFAAWRAGRAALRG